MLRAAPIVLVFVLPLLMSAVLYGCRRRVPPVHTILGYVHIDQLVYFADARESLEHGNALFYANPYDGRPDAPRVNSHLVFILWGWLMRLGLSDFAIDYGLRILLGWLMLWQVLWIFRRALASQPRPVRLFGAVAVLAGGGIAWLIALLQTVEDTVLAHLPLTLGDRLAGYYHEFQQVEGGYGQWQLNVFFNLRMTNEICFHVLFFAAILCLMRGRRLWAALFVFLTWWAHPFTGIELGAIAALYMFVEALLGGGTARWRGFALVAAIDLLFLAYYMVYLPRFPASQSLIEQFQRLMSHPMLVYKLLPAYGAFLILTALELIRRDFWRQWRRDPHARLMLVWLAVALGLVFHDRLPLLHPSQPMHFTRGYLFIPQVYFASRWLGRLWRRLAARPQGPRRAALALGLLLALHLPDNVLHLVMIWDDLPLQQCYAIPDADAAFLRRLDAIPETLTFAPVGPAAYVFNYEPFIPTRTHHRTLLGHPINTPFVDEKQAAEDRLRDGPDPAIFRRYGITGLIVDPDAMPALRRVMPPGSVEELFRADGLVVCRIHPGL